MIEHERLSEPPPKIDPQAKPMAMRLEWTDLGGVPACLMVAALDQDGRVIWIDFKPPEPDAPPLQVIRAAYRFGVRQDKGGT